MAKKRTIGIIGGGNMGAAIISSIAKLYPVILCEQDKRRAQSLVKKFKIKCQDIESMVKNADIVIIAVKPQSFDQVLARIKAYVSSEKLIISIAAGITSRFIEKRLGGKVKVIRTMPNLPAQIGLGVTAISRGKNATRADVSEAVAILKNIGTTLVVEEKQMDAITAVSGSGPAYVFLFVELFVSAARNLGFSLEESIALVSQTIEGSLTLLEETSSSPSELREKVTSKGGTTQAALDVFTKNNTGKIFKEALIAAKKRAKELSK